MEYSLTNARDGAVSSINGVVLSSKAITYGPKKYEGIEYTFTGKSDGEKIAGFARMYIIEGQFYKLQSVTSGATPSDSESSKKFLRSLKRQTVKGKKPEDDSDSAPEEG